MTGNDQIYDAIIIGAGIVGVSVAFALSKRGMKTLNVDALPAAGYGSTSNSSAVIRPFYSSTTMCALAHESRSCWLDWSGYLNAPDERGFAEYTECGLITVLGPGHRAQFNNSCKAMEAVGVPYEEWDAETYSARLPQLEKASYFPPRLKEDPEFGALSEGDLAGAIFVPEAGYVSDPQLAAHNLQMAAEANGATFRFNAKVAAILRKEDRASGIELADGDRLNAAVIVNACGPHSGKMNELAGVLDDMGVSTRALRTEVAYVPAPNGLRSVDGAMVLTDPDTGVYARTDVGDQFLIGTLEPECDTLHYVDPDGFNTELTEQWTTQVWRAALRVPDLPIPNTAQGVVALYDVTEDWIPVYDRSSLDGFYMAVGTSGNQFKNAPMIGEVMAALIAAVEAGRDHDASPVTMHLPKIGRDIDLGFFSRRRAVSDETTGTVLA